MRYQVKVHKETADDGPPTTYEVEADSPRDAKVIAFLLDGGWNTAAPPEEGDADSLVALAQMYAEIES